MAFSYTPWTGAKSPGDELVVGFPFLSRNYVSVLVDDEVVPTDYYQWTSDGIIECLAGFPSGGGGQVRRFTPRDAIPSQQAGSGAFDWQGANDNDTYVLHIQQEIDDSEQERDEAIAGIILMGAELEDLLSSVDQLVSDISNLASAAQAAAERAETAADAVENPLSYSPQTLNEAEQSQARSNIGAARDALATPSSSGLMSSSEKSKLLGVSAGATANSSDAYLRARSNHTGSQAISTITGLIDQLAGKAGTDHSHSASDITSGTLAAGRVPDLNASKITSGTLPVERGGTGETSEAGMRGVYTGTSQNNTNFPVGSRLMAVIPSSSDAVNRNSTIRVYLGSGRTYTATSQNISGTQLAGTWRMRGEDGGTATNIACEVERVA